MSRHRAPRIPNWLKAWYASLAFLAFVIFLSLMFGK